MQELNFIYYPKRYDHRKRSRANIKIQKSYISISDRYWEPFKDRYCKVGMTADKKYLILTPTDIESNWACCLFKNTIRVGSIKLMERLDLKRGGRDAHWDSASNSIIVEL